ncbi:MAG: pyridoxamine 5'-phosphate oxidase family protein [Thermoplasmatales archaeon]|nr:MAG: pyridoxamine 5'-phosphate oxidase family protein [Thermoplasmatales archaeon]
MEDIKEEIVNYLSKKKFITLATSTLNGKPLAHTIAYINKGPTLYFSTGNQSRKVKNIQENPNVAYSVYDETEYLDDIRFIQMEGIATLVSDKEESKEALKMLNQKFPSTSNLSSDPDSVIIKITPKICYFSDYIRRFGQRDKVEF